jgi:hypothetical protein
MTSQQMPKWDQLKSDLPDWLKSLAKGNMQYRRAFPGSSPTFQSDGMLICDRTLLAIEVEFAQHHPDTNVGKYCTGPHFLDTENGLKRG